MPPRGATPEKKPAKKVAAKSRMTAASSQAIRDARLTSAIEALNQTLSQMKDAIVVSAREQDGMSTAIEAQSDLIAMLFERRDPPEEPFWMQSTTSASAPAYARLLKDVLDAEVTVKPVKTRQMFVRNLKPGHVIVEPDLGTVTRRPVRVENFGGLATMRLHTSKRPTGDRYRAEAKFVVLVESAPVATPTNRLDFDTWRTGDGRILRPVDFDDEHLRNTLAYIRGHALRYARQAGIVNARAHEQALTWAMGQPLYIRLHQELIRRGLPN